jgi:hypothetical protein
VESRTGEWGPVLCPCGGLLADAMDDVHVVIRGVPLPFRRATDHLLCPACTGSYPVTELRRVRARAQRRSRLRRLPSRAGRSSHVPS